MNKNYKYTSQDVKNMADSVVAHTTQGCDKDDEIEMLADNLFSRIPDIQAVSIKYLRDCLFEAIRRDFNLHCVQTGLKDWTAKESDDSWKIVAVAKILAKIDTVRLILEDKEPYMVVYNETNGLYEVVTGPDDIIFCKMVYECVASAKKNTRAEIFNKLKVYVVDECGYSEQTVDARYEMYGDCVWDYEKMEKISFKDAKDRGFIFTRKASWTDINLNATTSPVWHDSVNNRDMTFDDIITEWLGNDRDKVCAVWDAMHGTMRPHNDGFQMAVYVVDTRTAGSNGKSTLAKCMQSLVGGLAHVDTTKLTEMDDKSEFQLSGLLNKSALICSEDDCNPHITSCINFKALVTNDAIEINQKYKNPVTMVLYMQLWFTCNGFPNFDDKSDSITRRLFFIDFSTHYPDEKKNADILNFLKRQDVREYVLNKLVHMNLNKYTLYPFQLALNNEFKEATNPVVMFLNDLTSIENRVDRYGENNHWDMYPYEVAYNLYNDWYMNEYKNCVSKIKKSEFIMRVETWCRNNQNGWDCTKSSREPDKIAKVYGSYSYLNNPEMFFKDFMYENRTNLTKYVNNCYSGADETKRYKPTGMPLRFTGIYRTYTYNCKNHAEVVNALKVWEDEHNTKKDNTYGGNKND